MKSSKLNKIELLSPAGDMERLKASIDFGADAVYLAGNEFGMRTSSSNFSLEELDEAVKLAHSRNVQIYLTCNTVPRNDEIKRLPEFLEEVDKIGIDALIISDIGVMELAKKYAPNVEIHISTQAGVANYMTANTLYNLGAKRVVLARELSLDEIRFIKDNVPSELELEVFVHGSMCVSFSGRCLISNYMTGRDANRGDCAQPCRWKYHLTEENRPGEYFPIEEDSKGTYFFNSKDLCMIDYIDKLIESGASSLKIEGRAKSAYYTSVVTNAYRHAIDDYYNDKDNWSLKPWIKDEMNKVSHRPYSNGFFFGKEPGQHYESGGYIRDYDVVAVCDDYKDGIATISQRNKFLKGDTLDVLPPLGGEPFLINVSELYDEWNNPVESAPHAMQKLFLKTDVPIKVGSIFRKKRS